MVIKNTNTDYDLIEMFSDEHDAFRREAFAKFGKRHSSFIYHSCYKMVLKNQFIIDPKEEAKDLYQNVLIKILKGSASFKRKKSINSDEIVFHVRGWIYKIVENTFIDEYLKKSERRPELTRFSIENQDKVEFDYLQKQSIPKKLSAEQKTKYKLIVAVMEKMKMSDMEIDVLRFYLKSGWFDDNDNWNLPPERMVEITSKYNVQKNTIIQCKRRLIEKIKKKVEF